MNVFGIVVGRVEEQLQADLQLVETRGDLPDEQVAEEIVKQVENGCAETDGE